MLFLAPSPPPPPPQNTFHAPADKMNQAYNDVMAYLDSVELVPSTESLIK